MANNQQLLEEWKTKGARGKPSGENTETIFDGPKVHTLDPQRLITTWETIPKGGAEGLELLLLQVDIIFESSTVVA